MHTKRFVEAENFYKSEGGSLWPNEFFKREKSHSDEKTLGHFHNYWKILIRSTGPKNQSGHPKDLESLTENLKKLKLYGCFSKTFFIQQRLLSIGC